MVDERPGRARQRRARSNAAATRRGEVRRRTAATALNVNAAERAERAATRPRRAVTRLAGDGTLLLRRRGCAKEQGEGARGLHAGAPACYVLRFATAGKQPRAGPAGREAGQRQGEVSPGKKNGATRDCRDAANAYGGRKRMGKEREDGAGSPRRRVKRQDTARRCARGLQRRRWRDGERGRGEERGRETERDGYGRFGIGRGTVGAAWLFDARAQAEQAATRNCPRAACAQRAPGRAASH
jgi:hypothetical protein